MSDADDITALRAEIAALAESTADTQRRVRQLQRSVSALTRHVRAMPADVQALGQLMTLLPPRGPLPAVGGWAMDPGALLWMADHVIRERVTLAVECGSGTSTVWLARALQAVGGRLVTLEHSAEYLALTHAQLVTHGVADVVELRHAPLVPTSTDRGELSWYDVGALDGPVDLLLVDGPPGATGPLARYPALPALGGLLADGGVVVVDDVSRRDEQDMVTHWLSAGLPDGRSLERGPQLGFNAEVLRVR